MHTYSIYRRSQPVQAYSQFTSTGSIVRVHILRQDAALHRGLLPEVSSGPITPKLVPKRWRCKAGLPCVVVIWKREALAIMLLIQGGDRSNEGRCLNSASAARTVSKLHCTKLLVGPTPQPLPWGSTYSSTSTNVPGSKQPFEALETVCHDDYQLEARS